MPGRMCRGNISFIRSRCAFTPRRKKNGCRRNYYVNASGIPELPFHDNIYRTEYSLILFLRQMLIGARGKPFFFPEQPDKIIHIGKATAAADGVQGLAGFCEQLLRQFKSLVIDEPERGESELFPEQTKKSIAAEMTFAAKIVDKNFFRNILANVIEQVMQLAAIRRLRRLIVYLLQVLALYQANEQFFQTQIGKNILCRIAPAANPDKFVDQ